MPKAKPAFPVPRYKSAWDIVVNSTGKLESLGALIYAASKGADSLNGKLQGIGQIIEEIAGDLKSTFDRIEELENHE